jgi:predicted DsbA family dithiol-disulfide isomerase
MNKLISIEVVSDVVCPWCYIGTLRLRRAIEKAGDASGFQVRYRPFELNPNLPVEADQPSRQCIRN